MIHRRTFDDATCKFWFLRPRRCHLVLQILVLLTVPLLTLTEWTSVPAVQEKRNSKISFRNLRSSQYSLGEFPKWRFTSPRSTIQWVVQQRNSKSWNKIAVLSQHVSSPWSWPLPSHNGGYPLPQGPSERQQKYATKTRNKPER